ncbi:EAL domain-containing protein [Aliidiomarina halalkaliphila]|uniref:EAL domain-containing protein n=1 Tax=Aliidiomarina halalkaliphila TaxID=2593535 RepID=A0A552X5A8_9GAMM|nr:EAL domain-containing protein [Aliidiomarina halalkaliphila]TRW50211.1 EAL domain-containing protein [Aliidiomarina halalkaliphila]
MVTPVANMAVLFEAIEEDSVSLFFEPVVRVSQAATSLYALHCGIDAKSLNFSEQELECVLSTAERHGLSGVIDQHCIRLAMREFAGSSVLSMEPKLTLLITANLDSFSSPAIVRDMQKQANALNFDLSQLVICIIERSSSRMFSEQIDVMREAIELGIRFCGVHTKAFPTRIDFLLQKEFTLLKINEDMVKEAITSQPMSKYFHNFYDSAHNLGKQVLIFGVESEQMLLCMRANGYEVLAGKYFSGPLSREQTEKMVLYWRNREIHVSLRTSRSHKLGLLHISALEDFSNDPRVVFLSHHQ